ncbi:Metalloendopeptidase [Meloidogyne graminicola]|uniref:Metalloendopeptidase n=1 Tax=Meloidogyne graminicola TaxID=189291 RepID=A0A8S9ZCR9_9BILA|nr:Metalloendopeptidase [Meloidogyne graminicola]
MLFKLIFNKLNLNYSFICYNIFNIMIFNFSRRFVNAENLSKEELYREMTLEEKAWVYRSEIRWNLKQNQNSVSNFRTKRNGVSRPQKNFGQMQEYLI